MYNGDKVERINEEAQGHTIKFLYDKHLYKEYRFELP